MKNVFFFKPPRPGQPTPPSPAPAPRAPPAPSLGPRPSWTAHEPPPRVVATRQSLPAAVAALSASVGPSCCPPAAKKSPRVAREGAGAGGDPPQDKEEGESERQGRAGEADREGEERLLAPSSLQPSRAIERRRHGRRVRGGARRVERHRRPRRVGAREVDPPDVGQAHVDAGEGLAAPLRGGDLLEDVRDDLKMERRIVFLVFFGQ